MAEAEIDVAVAALQISLCKPKRLAHHDRDRMKTQSSSATWQGFMRAKDAHGYNGGVRFRNDESEPGLRRLQVAVERAGAFGKNQHAMIVAQNANESLERAAISAFLINRNDIEPRQKPTENRKIEERLTREKIDRPSTSDSRKRRIEIALVVHCQYDRTFLNDTVGMDDAEVEEKLSNKARQMVDGEIPGVHCAIARPLSFRRPMISPTTPSIVKLELSMT